MKQKIQNKADINKNKGSIDIEKINKFKIQSMKLIKVKINLKINLNRQGVSRKTKKKIFKLQKIIAIYLFYKTENQFKLYTSNIYQVKNNSFSFPPYNHLLQN